MKVAHFHSPFPSFPSPICRLGLATRGNTHLTEGDIEAALERGVNFLNWCGCPDALSRTIASFGSRRSRFIVCVQFEARTAADAQNELRQILRELKTDYVDVLTLYYVEEPGEWEQINAPGGSMEFLRAAQQAGEVRRIGLTSHQRPLAAAWAKTGRLDLLMIRYNAAHRGAEMDIFPVTDELGLPVIVYTCLRWGALLRPTPDDPPGFVVPPAPAWYRFALQPPSVTVALMAPNDRAELVEDLTVLQATGPVSVEEYAGLAEHGRRVRRHAGGFP
jgi:predicted aldo/keto reductase-like oxidoreductase